MKKTKNKLLVKRKRSAPKMKTNMNGPKSEKDMAPSGVISR
jgi:hypothetical protein